MNFYDMYDLLYQKINGTYTLLMLQMTIWELVLFIEFPRNDFESVIMAYFNIDSETLQSKTIYYAENETYEYKPRGFEEVEYPEYHILRWLDSRRTAMEQLHLQLMWYFRIREIQRYMPMRLWSVLWRTVGYNMFPTELYLPRIIVRKHGIHHV